MSVFKRSIREATGSKDGPGAQIVTYVRVHTGNCVYARSLVVPRSQGTLSVNFLLLARFLGVFCRLFLEEVEDDVFGHL